MRETIARMYGCPVIYTDSENSEQNLRGKRSHRDLDPHCNILPALVAIETPQTFIIIFESFIPHTLQVTILLLPEQAVLIQLFSVSRTSSRYFYS